MENVFIPPRCIAVIAPYVLPCYIGFDLDEAVAFYVGPVTERTKITTSVFVFFVCKNFDIIHIVPLGAWVPGDVTIPRSG